MNAIGNPGLSSGRDIRECGGDGTVVTTSSSTTVRTRSNVSDAARAQNKPASLYQSMGHFVADQCDITLNILQSDSALLVVNVRGMVLGARNLSDEQITEQFLAALPRPEGDRPQVEAAPPPQEIPAVDTGIDDYSSLFTSEHLPQQEAGRIHVPAPDAAIDGSEGASNTVDGTAVESVNIEEAARALVGSEVGSSVQNFDPLPAEENPADAKRPVMKKPRNH